MSTLEDSRMFDPVPPRPFALRPRPSARKVVGKCGMSPGSTTATARAVTPTTRPTATNADVGSANGPDAERGAAAAVPHERSDRTPCRPTRASQARAAGHGEPRTEPVTGVRRGREEGGEQGDAGQCRAAVGHADRVDGHRGEPDEQAHGEDRPAVGRRRRGVVRDGLVGLGQEHAERGTGVGDRHDLGPQVALAVEDRGAVQEQHDLPDDDERARRREAPQPHADERDERDEQQGRPEPRRRRREQRREREGRRPATARAASRASTGRARFIGHPPSRTPRPRTTPRPVRSARRRRWPSTRTTAASAVVAAQCPEPRTTDRDPPGERRRVDDHRGPGRAGLPQRGEGAGVVVGERSADVDDEPALRREGAGGVEDGTQAVVGSGRDAGQGVQAGLVGLVVVRAGVGARVRGEEVHGIPRGADVGGDRGGRRDAPLERAAAARPGVSAGPAVEDDDRPALRRPVLLTHHELAGARGCRPVDAPQVVAVAVLPHRLVVLAVQRDHVRHRALGADAAAERPGAGQGDDAGEDDELGVTADRRGPQAEAEGVAHAHRQRADAVDAAGVRAHGVLDLLHRSGSQRGDDEPRPVAEGVVDRLLGHDDRGRRSTRGCGCAP